MSRVNKCGDCLFFHQINDDGGHCKLNPPLATLVPQQNFSGQTVLSVMSYYPEVSNESFCGKFEANNVSNIVN